MTKTEERRYQELNVWADMQTAMRAHLTAKAEALTDIPMSEDKARQIAELHIGRYKCLCELTRVHYEQMLLLGAKP